MKTTRPILPGARLPIPTPRLRLREAGEPGDLADLYDIRCQMDVMCYSSLRKPDADEAATQIYLDKFLPANAHNLYGYMVEMLDFPGKVIGTVAIFNPECPEFGILFDPEQWGKGFATEAGKAVLEAYWTLPRKEVEISKDSSNSTGTLSTSDVGSDKDTPAHVKPEIISARVFVGNDKSKRALENLGFELEHTGPMTTPDGSFDAWYYELQRP